VLCGSCLSDEPITRSEESYRPCVPNFVRCISLKRRRTGLEFVCSATEKIDYELEGKWKKVVVP